MKEIKLFVSVKLTSLSPDAQVISLGIVSEDIPSAKKVATAESQFGNIDYYKAGTLEFHSKSFYSEFTDFDINRCDDWVKENVVGKLKYNDLDQFLPEYGTNDMSGKGSTSLVKLWLYRYLEQFSDYQIQFVADCGTWDWYYLLQLIAEWDEVPAQLIVDTSCIRPDQTIEDFINEWNLNPVKVLEHLPQPKYINIGGKIGLPKLPSNISPVPLDLNDLIAFKKGISVKEAFEIDREHFSNILNDNLFLAGDDIKEMLDNKHNSLWDAKVIKSIYEKLM